MQVQGVLHVSRVVAHGRGDVVVRVLDVSHADASSTVVAEVDLGEHVLVPGEAFRLPFTVEVGDPDPRARLAVTGHVDVSGSGDVTRGDYLTTEHVGLPVADDGRRGPASTAPAAAGSGSGASRSGSTSGASRTGDGGSGADDSPQLVVPLRPI